MNSALYYYAVITTFLILVTMAGQCITPGKNHGKLIFSLFLFCIGICQGYHALMISGLLLEYPHFGLVHTPFLYLLGPVTYFYFKLLVRDEVQLRKNDLIHFLPAVLVALVLLPFYTENTGYKKIFLMNPPGLEKGNPFSTEYLVLLFIFTVSAIIYLAIFLKNNTFILNRKKLKVKNIVYLSHGIIIAVFMVIFIYLTGITMSNIVNGGKEVYLIVIKIIVIITGILSAMIFFMDRRYPDYYKELRNEMDSIRYNKSRIEGLNVEEVETELTRLMEEEHIYCDEELSLKKLADDLNIASYQLSQILNQNKNQNFNSFINIYRIQAARQMLLDEPDRSINSAAYAVGFNSMSSFYDWFLKLTGTTPAKFRAEDKQKSGSKD